MEFTLHMANWKIGELNGGVDGKNIELNRGFSIATFHN